MATFQEKLVKESSKIIQWQVKRDVQCKQMKRKLAELEELVERQRKNLLQQQMNCEKISQEYANEVQHHQELEEKVQQTLKIAGILQEYFQNMTSTFLSFEKAKTTLESRCDSIKEKYDQLIEKFEVMTSRHLKELEYNKKLLHSEKEHHSKNEKQWNAVCNSFEKKLKESSEKIHLICSERNNIEKQVNDLKTELQRLCEVKERDTKELTGELVKFKEILNKHVNEKKTLIMEIENLRKMYNDYTDLKNAHEATTLEAKKLESNLTEAQTEIEKSRMILADKKFALENAIEENNKLKNEYTRITQEMEQIKTQADDNKGKVQKLECEIGSRKSVLQQKMNDITLLQNNRETETLKLSELLKAEEMKVNYTKVQLEDQMSLTTTVNDQIQQVMLQVKAQERKNEELQAAISAECGKLEGMKHFSNELQQRTENLNLSVESLRKEIDEKGNVKTIFEMKIKETELAIKNKEMECSTKIKDMLSSMEEYKHSYINKLSALEEEKRKLHEKIVSLEKENREYSMEKKIMEEKVIYHENLSAKSLSKKQMLEIQLLQLKAEVEKEKSKAPSITEVPVIDEISTDVKQPSDPDSPKSIIRQPISTTKKKIAYENWSDSTDDSSLDVALYQANNSARQRQHFNTDDDKATHLKSIVSNDKTKTSDTMKTSDAKKRLSLPYPSLSQPLPGHGTKFFRRNQKTATKFHEGNKQDVFGT